MNQNSVKKHSTSLRGLRTFCAAARHESFRAAGEALSITSSAVSHQIKNIENELGSTLFDRSGRALKLTAAGSQLFSDISPLIDQIDTVVAAHRSTLTRKAIRISIQPFFASEYFVPRLSEFTSQHPSIDLQLGTSDESAEKHPADADLSIRLFKSAPAELPSDLLFPLRLAPAASPDFARTLKVEDRRIVSDFPIIVHESHPAVWVRWAQENRYQLPAVGRSTRLDSMIAVARAAERGIGAALLAVPLANAWFESGTLVRLFEEELVTDVSYYLTCRKESLQDPDVQQFRDWILQNFAVGT